VTKSCFDQIRSLILDRIGKIVQVSDEECLVNHGKDDNPTLKSGVYAGRRIRARDNLCVGNILERHLE
jgi:hypothetical protein